MARVSDSEGGCRPLQSPCRLTSLHMTRRPSVFPVSSQLPWPCSNPPRQSPRPHSTRLFPSRGSLSLSRATPPPALPTSLFPVARICLLPLHRPLPSRLLSCSNFSAASE